MTFSLLTSVEHGGVSKRGSITLVVLVIVMVFVVMMTASLQFLARQSHVISMQKQQQQAFVLADSGVQHTIWMLNNIEEAPGDLEGILERELTDAEDQVIGSFMVNYGDGAADWLKLTSTGKVPGNVERCVAIDASLALFSTELDDSTALGDSYRVVRWRFIGNVTCPVEVPPTDLPPTETP